MDIKKKKIRILKKLNWDITYYLVINGFWISDMENKLKMVLHMGMLCLKREQLYDFLLNFPGRESLVPNLIVLALHVRQSFPQIYPRKNILLLGEQILSFKNRSLGKVGKKNFSLPFS